VIPRLRWGRNDPNSAEPNEVQPTLLRGAAALVAAALVVVSFLVLEPVSDAIVGAAGCVLLVALALVDLETWKVPNRIIVPALGVALVVRTALDPRVEWIVAALAAGGILLLLALIHPKGLGMGDVKLAAFLGAWLGWEALIALALASFAAFLPALVIIVMRGRAARKVPIQFAPFLAIGGIVALFAGHEIFDWYSGLG
jgi:leader peptidase (prepilin peptidase)/N-methyltransferase